LAASHALCITSANDNDAWAMRCTSKNGKVTGASGTVALFNTYQDFPTIMANAGLNNVTVASGSADWNGIAWDQRNSVWAWNVIGAGTIYDTACGILSTCNAINYLHGSFANTTTANTFILDWANYAHSFGGFNPGQYGADGGYRYRMFGTDISNPPPLQTKYGSTYNFTMPILWTENWNSANYYNGGYYNNIYVNSQTSLKNYLAGDAVAIAHVPGHFICLADYDPATDKFLVLDSYPTWARGTQATAGVEWVSANELSGGRPSLTVGGFCVLKSTKTASTTTTTTQTNKYPYTSGSKYMLYDGETTYEVAGDDASKTKIYLHYEDTQGESSLKMDCTAPTAIGSKGGYASQLLKSATNLSTYKNFGFDLYLGNDMVGSHSFKVGFWSSGKEVYKATVNLSNLKAGWHEFVMPVTDLVPVSGGKLTQVDALAYTWFNTAKTKNATYICVDNVRMFNGNLSVSEGEKVKEMIGKLPATVTKEDAAAIEEARTAYDTLSQTEKAKVSNLVVLEQAEAQLKALEEEQQPGGEQPDVLYGDLNEDKLVDAKDALIVLRIAVAKQIPTQYQKLVGDVNGDSGIDAKDALEILKKTVGKIDKFPVEQ
ncbi:MAG: hypothetical protein IKM39_01990, partial [Clostridia bacterium]|nr:hypothetical protein [Clostridia bacterium]